MPYCLYQQYVLIFKAPKQNLAFFHPSSTSPFNIGLAISERLKPVQSHNRPDPIELAMATTLTGLVIRLRRQAHH